MTRKSGNKHMSISTECSFPCKHGAGGSCHRLPQPGDYSTEFHRKVPVLEHQQQAAPTRRSLISPRCQISGTRIITLSLADGEATGSTTNPAVASASWSSAVLHSARQAHTARPTHPPERHSSHSILPGTPRVARFEGAFIMHGTRHGPAGVCRSDSACLLGGGRRGGQAGGRQTGGRTGRRTADRVT